MKAIVIKLRDFVKRNYPGVISNAIYRGIIGSAVYAFFFILSLADQRLFSYMGVNSKAALEIIRKFFWLEILLMQLKILLTYAVIGFIVGFVLSYFWQAVLGTRFGQWRLRFKLPLMIISLVVVQLYFLFANMLKYPQIYSEYFYERSPWRKDLQLFITSHLHPYFFKIIAIIFVLCCCYFLYKKLACLPRLIMVVVTGASLCVWVLVMVVQKTYTSPLLGPNIIIIGADSLRNDHVNRELTPHLWALAQKGIRFQRCYVSLPRTFPQWITYLKSRYPSVHGIRNMFPDKSVRHQQKDSLCQVLKQNGYTTAVVSDFAGDVFTRFDADFDVIKAPYFNFNVLVAQRCLEMHYLLLPFLTNELGRQIFPVLKEMANNGDPCLLEKEVERVIKTSRDKQKLFLVMFSSVTHFPYAAPYPYYQYYTDRNYQGDYKYYKPNIPGERLNLPPADVEQIRGLYKGAVRNFDDAVGKLLAYLRKQKMDQNTIIVVLADHGEQLYEEGRGQGHGEHLRGNAVLNVPFIFYDPRENYPVKESQDLVRDIDLAPTILNMVKISAPAVMDGASLLPLAASITKSLGLAAYAETGLWFTDKGDNFYQKQRIMYPDIIGLAKIDNTYNNEVIIKPEYFNLTNIAKHRMIRTAKYKLIYVPVKEKVKYELYDMEKDPLELNDIASQNPGVVKELKDKLFNWMAKDKNCFWRNEYLVPLP